METTAKLSAPKKKKIEGKSDIILLSKFKIII